MRPPPEEAAGAPRFPLSVYTGEQGPPGSGK